MIEDEILKKCLPDFKKLLEYGFYYENEMYTYKKNILDDTFQIVINVFEDGRVIGKVYDLELEDEYTSFRIEDNIGEFAGTIRNQFEDVLLDIKDKCFITQQFVSNQANRISKIIKEKYGDSPCFEWESTPDAAVFKNKNTKKWYGLVMNIPRDRVGTDDGRFDILNVKLDPSEIEELVKETGFYPAYHMNKKYWVTISLDEVVDDDRILKLIDKSYSYADGNSSKKADKEWIIPANPKYYDIEDAFNHSNIINWKQSTDIRVGDIIYIYVGAPVSAITYKCVVKKNNIPYDYVDDNLKMKYVMEIELIDKYDKSLYPFSKLKEFGVNAVRGPRKIPKSLSDFINKK